MIPLIRLTLAGAIAASVAAAATHAVSTTARPSPSPSPTAQVAVRPLPAFTDSADGRLPRFVDTTTTFTDAMGLRLAVREVGLRPGEQARLSASSLAEAVYGCAGDDGVPRGSHRVSAPARTGAGVTADRSGEARTSLVVALPPAASGACPAGLHPVAYEARFTHIAVFDEIHGTGRAIPGDRFAQAG